MSADLLEKIENRRARIRRTVEELQEEIKRLGEELTTAEHALERLEITHQTLVELTTEDTPTPADPLPDGYRDVLALFVQDQDGGLRAKDACRALGAGTEPRHVEGMRAKLKRLVERGVLTEPEPGLFVLPRPTPPTPEINPH
ncbi:hypothetical protein [Parafrankia elaeagni]|uniref:hypothetical protein n=1 Tax=Parafrankia elaeagni TaxID=222534 RepID=UPI0003666968|nr:hypothetical protein [Parafrankia elaeagni]